MSARLRAPLPNASVKFFGGIYIFTIIMDGILHCVTSSANAHVLGALCAIYKY
jgi:hypothetical protein